MRNPCRDGRGFLIHIFDADIVIINARTSYLLRESLLSPVAVSAKGHRNISYGGIGDTAMNDNRYWNG
jgi:hypothetical protein